MSKCLGDREGRRQSGKELGFLLVRRLEKFRVEEEEFMLVGLVKRGKKYQLQC